MSAVATVLGLLLVVSFLSNYLVNQLPGEMGDVEFGHLVQVENQVERVQATILQQASHPGIALPMSSPITLGSSGVPPFGPPSLGTVAPESAGVGTSNNYYLDTIVPAAPIWGAFSACLPGGSGHCAGSGDVNYANYSANDSALTATITGGNESLIYNINGNNDTFTLQWNGKDIGVVAVVINGSYDSVIFNKAGSDVSTPTVSFYFFGTNDTYSMSMAGSHSSKGGMQVNVQFVGILGYLCPYDNSSTSDSVKALGAGGSKLNLTVSWWNADGYVTAPHRVAYPGSTIGSEQIIWQNQTGFVGCPFLQIIPSKYTSLYYGGIDVHLSNRYQPPNDVAYESGAVILAVPGQRSLMLNGPEFTFNETSSGLTAHLVIVHLTGAPVAQSGVGTSSVVTRVTSVATATFGGGVNRVFLATPFYINISTEFPSAWLDYFNGQNNPFPFGASCVVPNPPLPPGYSCTAPPTGTVVRVIAPLYAQTVTLTVVQVAVAIR